ncbi:hypothetical protein DdX_18347 [Ditylenchus destructor]|uniref:Uncharacterized protein n=1 Tax=Ditylenchus destructor TaxID=166010 RepID=A0AAD4MKZ0_9BILA|nr:hypothetical protein DdX_18347 [Ditylenchus destructor]
MASNVTIVCEYSIALVLYSISLVLLLRILRSIWLRSKKFKKNFLTKSNVTASLLIYLISWSIVIIVSLPFLLYYIVTWRPAASVRDGPTLFWLAIWSVPSQICMSCSVLLLTLERISYIHWPALRHSHRKYPFIIFGVSIGLLLAWSSILWTVMYELPIPPTIDCAAYACIFRPNVLDFYTQTRRSLAVLNSLLGIYFFVLLQKKWKAGSAAKCSYHRINVMAGVVLIAEFSLNILPMALTAFLYYCCNMWITTIVGPIFNTILVAMDVFIASVVYTTWLGKRLKR